MPHARNWSVARLVLVAVAATIASTCGSNPTVFENAQYDFAGRVATIEIEHSVVEVRLVADPALSGGDRVVRIDRETRLLRRERDGTYRPVSQSDITVGAFLRVKTTGVESRSLPPQYDAVWVAIVPEPA